VTGIRVEKIKLLLIDKHDLFREGLAKLLQDDPNIAEVYTCASLLEFSEIANEHQFDVIIIDYEISDFNGILYNIREVQPEIKTIVLTHSVKQTDLYTAIKAGARAYISKSITIQNLIRTICLVADGEYAMSPPMATMLLEEFKSLGKLRYKMKLIQTTLLSEREKQVLEAVKEGLTNRQIAATLFISEYTVKVHLRNIMGKLDAHTRQQAVVLAGEKDIV